MIKLLFSVQLKTLHHFRSEVVIVALIYFGSDPQQFQRRKIKMLRKVFDIANARVQGRRRYPFTVHLNNAVRNILIPGDRFKKRSFTRSISAKQTIDPRFVDR